MIFQQKISLAAWLGLSRAGWSWLVFLLIVSLTILGQVPAIPAFIALILFAVGYSGRLGAVSSPKRLFLFLVLQYLIFHGLKVAVFDGLEPLKADLAQTYVYYWVIAVLLVGFLYVFFEVGKDIPGIL